MDRKQGFILLFFLFSCTALFAQYKNQAKNVRLFIDDEQVRILYDLPSRVGAKYQVKLRIKKSSITPLRVIGEGENMSGGNDLEVIWPYPANNLTRQQVEDMKIELVAIDPSLPPSNRNIVIASIGFGSVGVGLITFGAIAMSNAKNGDAYQTYQENRNPNDPVWADLGYTSSGDPREELYTDQNNKYKTGQVLMIAGGAVLVAGAIVAAKLLRKNKASRKNVTLYPMVDPGLVQKQNPLLGAGLAVRLY
jgi:hypothetical protein